MDEQCEIIIKMGHQIEQMEQERDKYRELLRKQQICTEAVDKELGEAQQRIAVLELQLMSEADLHTVAEQQHVSATLRLRIKELEEERDDYSERLRIMTEEFVKEEEGSVRTNAMYYKLEKDRDSLQRLIDRMRVELHSLSEQVTATYIEEECNRIAAMQPEPKEDLLSEIDDCGRRWDEPPQDTVTHPIAQDLPEQTTECSDVCHACGSVIATWEEVDYRQSRKDSPLAQDAPEQTTTDNSHDVLMRVSNIPHFDEQCFVTIRGILQAHVNAINNHAKAIEIDGSDIATLCQSSNDNTSMIESLQETTYKKPSRT